MGASLLVWIPAYLPLSTSLSILPEMCGFKLMLLGHIRGNSFVTVLKDILILVPRALYVGKVFASFEKMKP
jgi:hypothetical protein